METLKPDLRSPRSFVTYKSIMRERKEAERFRKDIPVIINEEISDQTEKNRYIVPKWEKRRLEKKKYLASKSRETMMDMIESYDNIEYFD